MTSSTSTWERFGFLSDVLFQSVIWRFSVDQQAEMTSTSEFCAGFHVVHRQNRMRIKEVFSTRYSSNRMIIIMINWLQLASVSEAIFFYTPLLTRRPDYSSMHTRMPSRKWQTLWTLCGRMTRVRFKFYLSEWLLLLGIPTFLWWGPRTGLYWSRERGSISNCPALSEIMDPLGPCKHLSRIL